MEFCVLFPADLNVHLGEIVSLYYSNGFCQQAFTCMKRTHAVVIYFFG